MKWLMVNDLFSCQAGWKSLMGPSTAMIPQKITERLGGTLGFHGYTIINPYNLQGLYGIHRKSPCKLVDLLVKLLMTIGASPFLDAATVGFTG